MRNKILPLLLVLVFALLTLPVWRWLWGEWWRSDYYSHGVLIVIVAVVLAWRRLASAGQTLAVGEKASAPAFLALGVTLALFLLWLNERAYYLAAFTMIGVVAALIWALGGLPRLRQLLFPVAFLALMVPLPFADRVTLPLAQWTGVISGLITRALGLPVAVNGSSVTLPEANLIIGAQCSGINSIMALLALTALAAYLLAGPGWARWTLFLSAVPLAMLGNFVRVISLIFVADNLGANAAFQFYHDYSGYVSFLGALALLIPLARLLQCKTVRYEVL